MKTIQKNGSTINVYLPKKLFEKLKKAIEERQKRGEKPKLQLAQAAYFLNLPIFQLLTRKSKHENEYEDEWAPLCSQILKRTKHFSHYMNFLVGNGLLERHPKNYSTATETCFRYRLPKPYRKHVLKKVEVTAHKNFVEARNRRQEERKQKADESVPHLTKWLDPGMFHVDYDSAMAYISEKYHGEALIGKKNKRIIAIEGIKEMDWGYSREGKDDRLHSLLTRLPKDLKKFVMYSDFGPPASLDIKSSQPFIFISLIQILYFNNTSCFSNHLPEYLNNRHILSNMFNHIDQKINQGALQRFIYEVLSGKFYENYGLILYKEGLLMKKVDNSFFFHGTTENGKEMFEYETLRDAAKDLIMRTFFSSPENTHNYVRVFEKSYPEAFAVMQSIKRNEQILENMKSIHADIDKKNLFPVLLQNIEANFMLDFATNRIAKDYPEIPLFTIHDSINTNQGNVALVEQEFRKYLFEYFGHIPQLSCESWSKDCERAA